MSAAWTKRACTWCARAIRMHTPTYKSMCERRQAHKLPCTHARWHARMRAVHMHTHMHACRQAGTHVCTQASRWQRYACMQAGRHSCMYSSTQTAALWTFQDWKAADAVRPKTIAKDQFFVGSMSDPTLGWRAMSLLLPHDRLGGAGVEPGAQSVRVSVAW